MSRALHDLEELARSLTPEQRATLAALDEAGEADYAGRDDALGTQKRFDPAHAAFLVCMIHEHRRAAARGLNPGDHYVALGAVLGRLVSQVGVNAALQAGVPTEHGVDLIARIATDHARTVPTLARPGAAAPLIPILGGLS